MIHIDLSFKYIHQQIHNMMPLSLCQPPRYTKCEKERGKKIKKQKPRAKEMRRAEAKKSSLFLDFFLYFHSVCCVYGKE
jgi:hypothetical protein